MPTRKREKRMWKFKYLITLSKFVPVCVHAGICLRGIYSFNFIWVIYSDLKRFVACFGMRIYMSKGLVWEIVVGFKKGFISDKGITRAFTTEM